MRFFLKSLLAINLLAFTACNNNNENRLSVKDSNIDFPTEISVPDSAITLPSIISIDEWTIGNRGLLCLSLTTDKLFYNIDTDDFQTLDSFGVMGQGPGEYLFPHVVKSSNNNTIVAETMLRAFHKIDGENRETTICPAEQLMLNDPNEIKYPIIGFYELTRDEKQVPVKIWRSMDVSEGATIDSLVFNYSDMPAEIQSANLLSSVSGNHIVFIRNFIDEYIIAELDDTGKIAGATKYVGNKSPSIDCPGYCDVACGDGYFYLLSNKNISYSSGDNRFSAESIGKSEIEIIDYEGNPVAKLKLDIVGRKMLLDKNGSRLLLLSADDDDIHIVPLNRL